MLGAPETDLALMQRLMDNGIASARDLQLTPGIALTKEQFNQLDQDIIWMEQRVVNGQRVMVPVVYLAPSTLKELGKSSATIAATNIDLKTGSLVNSGTFAAREILKLDTQSLLNFGGSLLSEGSLLVSSAGDIINRSGTISGSSVGLFAGGNILNTTDSVQRIDGTGALANSHTQFGNTGSISSTGDLALKAEGDIRNLGANLSTKGNAILQAGQDIEIGGIAATSEIHVRGPGMTLDLNQTGHLGSQLDIGQNLTLSAGQDVTLAGADVAVGGDATLAAGRDLSITTLTDTLQASGMVKGAGVKFSTATDRTTEIGTLLTTGGNLTLASGNDLTVRGSEIEAGKAITLAADGDVRLEASHSTSDIHTEEIKKKNGLLSSKKTTKTTDTVTDEATGSILTGESISINSGKDIFSEGATLIGDSSIQLFADGNITLDTAVTTRSEERTKQTKASGFLGADSNATSTSMTFGKRETTSLDQSFSTEHFGTFLSAEDITVNSGVDTLVRGGELHAKNDLLVEGNNVTIENVFSTHDGYHQDTFKQSGVTLSLQVTGPYAEVVNSAVQATATDNERARNLRMAQTGGEVVSAYSSYSSAADAQAAAAATNTDAAPSKNVDISVDLSYGTSKSQNESTTHQSSVIGSILDAGNDLVLKARDGDLAVTGSSVQAENNLTLSASDDILLKAAQDTYGFNSSNKSSSASVGVSYGLLATWGVNASGSLGKGSENVDSVTHIETQVSAGNILTLDSGNDTTLEGAQAHGKQIIAGIGGDLSILTLQDTEDLSGDQKNISGGISYTYTGNNASANLSASNGEFDGESRITRERSGLFAGEGGFDINVGGATSLTGAVIHSEATPDQNRLATGSLDVASLEDVSKWSLETGSVSLSGSYNTKTGGSGNGPNGVGMGLPSSDGGDETRTVASGISAGELIVEDGMLPEVRRDTQALLDEEILDSLPDDLQQQLAEAQEIAAAAKDASASLAKAVGDIATAIEKQQRKELNDLLLAAVKRGDLTVEEAMAIYEQPNPWGENQINRVLTHMLTQGLIAGIAGGDAGSGLQGAGGVLAGSLASQLAQSFNEQTGIQGALADFTKNIVNGAAGSLVGGAGGAAAGSVDENNRQLHPNEMFFIFGLAHEFAKANGLTIEEAKTILIRGALYLNDADWKAQYDKYYGTEVSKYLAAGNYVREAAAAVGFNLEINGVTQAAFTSTAEQYQNTSLGVKELATQRLLEQYLAYATIRASGDFSSAAYLAALNAGELAGLPVGVGQGVTGLVEGTLSFAALIGENLFNTVRYGTTEADRLTVEKLGLSGLSSETFGEFHDRWGDAAGDAYLNYIGLLSLYEAQGAGWDLGYTRGQVSGKLTFDLASLFTGVGEITSLLDTHRAMALGTKAATTLRVGEGIAEQTAGGIRVIGKLDDTADYAFKKGYEIIPQANWSLFNNWKWVQEGINAGAPFKVVSSRSGTNMINAGELRPGPTAFGREIWQLRQSGYAPIKPGSDIWIKSQ